MSKGSYFSQYESPNIVIVPTMSSCKPPSPKRQKVRNNIIVPPIANNDSSDTEKLKHKQELKKPNTVKVDTGEGSSKNSNINKSWASKYLQSIGLDKKSSIWNHKIPRKSSQNVVSIETSQNLISDVSLNSTCISRTDNEKSNQKKIPNKIPTNTNILDNKSATTTKRLEEIRKYSLKEIKQSKNIKKQDPNNAEKSNIKSVVLKDIHKQDKGKCIAKDNTRLKQIKSSSSRPVSCVTSNYKEKYKNEECSIVEEGPINRNEKKIDLKKLTTSKNAKSNIKSKIIHNKSETTKSNEKFAKKKSESKTKKTSIKSPIKRIVPKPENYRKIKLVINVICNPHPPQRSDSSNIENINCNKTCTRPNVDLDFLNDINVDEIVESLYTCEKKGSKHVSSERELNKYHNKKTLEANGNTSQSDATDLIKILKGEEDDDLVRMSIENEKTLYNNDSPIVTQSNKHSHMFDNVSKSGETKRFNSNLTLPVKIKEEKLEILNTEILESTSASNIQHKMITNVSPIQPSNSLCEIKNEHSIEKHQTKCQDDHSVIDNINFEEALCAELRGNESKKDTMENTEQTKDEKKNNSLVNIDSPPTLENIKIDTYKTDSKLLKTETAVNSTKESTKDNNEKTIHKTGANNIAINNISTSTAVGDDHRANNSTNKNSKPQHDIINVNQVETSNKDANNIAINNISTSTAVGDDHRANNSTNKNNKPQHDIINVNQVETSSKDCQQNSTEHHGDKNGNTDASFSNINSDDPKSIISRNHNSYPPNVNQTNNSGKQKELSIVNGIEVQEGKTTNNHSCDAQEVGSQELTKNDKKGNQNVEREENDTEGNKREKQKEVSENETKNEKECQRNISDKTKVVSNFKPKVDIEIVEKVEERLLKCTGTKYCIATIMHTGKYSKIFKCTHPNGKYYALKMLTNTKYYLGKEKSQMVNTLMEGIPKENLFLVYMENHFNVAEKWCFLMEYYPKNLYQALEENKKPFSIEQIQHFARQLTMAVLVLKNNNMVHLDIQPRHILINYSNKRIKLCGFDSLSYINKISILPNLGTVNYRAPEVILGFRAGFEIDVWSTGLVLYEMATNTKLFPGFHNNNILYKQICTLGTFPYDMIQRSRFGDVHFVGSKFMKRSGIRGQDISIISKFYKNNMLHDSIYKTYYTCWARGRTTSQMNIDIIKVGLFMKLIQKMLTVHPEMRVPIEYVYANPFMYDAYLYQGGKGWE